jgi:hypothetical protein
MKEVIIKNPFTWFDNNSMAFTIKEDRRTVSRAKKRLLEDRLIQVKGRYFSASRFVKNWNESFDRMLY